MCSWGAGSTFLLKCPLKDSSKLKCPSLSIKGHFMALMYSFYPSKMLIRKNLSTLLTQLFKCWYSFSFSFPRESNIDLTAWPTVKVMRWSLGITLKISLLWTLLPNIELYTKINKGCFDMAYVHGSYLIFPGHMVCSIWIMQVPYVQKYVLYGALSPCVLVNMSINISLPYQPINTIQTIREHDIFRNMKDPMLFCVNQMHAIFLLLQVRKKLILRVA